MDNEMLIIQKADLKELIEQFKLFNENIKNINLNGESKNIFFTRDEAQEHYGLSKREVDKIYNNLLKNKVVNIGKNTRLAKVHIDKLFTNGVQMKHV